VLVALPVEFVAPVPPPDESESEFAAPTILVAIDDDVVDAA
jgi:hypothetical protein